jgi:1-acyl-sn-glycerol-3-phosphate acyltransferase
VQQVVFSMTPDQSAILTLAVLMCLAALAMLKEIRDAGSFSVWLLTRIFRTYSLVMLSQRMHGRCPLPVHGGALLVCNHRSPTDPMLLYSASLLKEDGYSVRVLEFLTAGEYCRLGGPVEWITRTARVIPVQRDGKDTASAKEALRRLQAGRIVGVFPEGGIHLGSGLGEFNQGVAWLALRGGQPVIPAVVRNSPYRDPIFCSFLARQPADVVFGEPVDLTAWTGCKPTPDTLRDVTARIRRAIEELQITGGRASCSPWQQVAARRGM